MAACEVLSVDTSSRGYSIRSPEVIGAVEMSAGHKQDIWASILESGTSSTKEDSAAGVDLPPPYAHHLLRRTPTFMSQSSLELCTETLGSETGSDGFSDMVEKDSNFHHSSYQDSKVVEEEKQKGARHETTLNYRFPPPLPSITHSGIRTRVERRDGRLLIDALPLDASKSRQYLSSQRQGGRLVLSFVHPVLKQEAEQPHSEAERSTASRVMDEFAGDGGLREAARCNIAAAAAGRRCAMQEQESVLTWEPCNFITSYA